MKYLVVLLIFAGSTMYLSNAFAWCPQNEDWPDRPCYATFQNWGIEKERSDWAPYFDFKGSEWMESKKQEMTLAIKNDTLSDWIELTSETQAHRNVYEYYFIFGEVQNLDGKFVDESRKPMELEEKHQFIDFSYANNIGDPIKFVLEKTSYSHCNSYNAKITDEDENIVWEEGAFALCDPPNSTLITSQIKIGYNKDNPIILNESGKYYLEVELDNFFTKREFVVRQNHTEITLDRTVYPVPWFELSPLKQIKSGISIDKIQCKENLALIQKYDGSPACVTESTKLKRIERGWTVSEGVSSEFEIGDVQTAFTDGVTEIINPEHEPLKYKTTVPVIDKTYLSKNVQQWNDAMRSELDMQHGIYGDEFYNELGTLLIKNEMQYQMNALGIVNANDDFEVFSGMSLDSLPPHIGFSAVVYATDGNYYRLQGGTFANQVSYYRTTQLQFPDTAEKLSMKSMLSDPQLITIVPEDGSKARQEPSTLVIHVDNATVEFFNNTPDVIRIQDSGSGIVGEEDTLDWVGPTILPFQKSSMTFDKPGLIEWDARKAPNLENPLWWQTHAGGNIVVLSDDMNNFSREDKARIAQKMLHNSDVPIVSSGAGNAEKVLMVGLDPAVVKTVPNAEEYYLKRAHQLIPFDVEIVMSE